MLLSDRDIRVLCVQKLHPPLIDPFSEGVQGGKVISFGLTHAGYDLRLGYKLYVFKNTTNEIVDPKKFKGDDGLLNEMYMSKLFDIVEPSNSELGKYYIVPAHSYVLGVALEHMHLPRHIKGRCTGKSTFARAGIIINTTPVEPGWKGFLTIEIANVSPSPVAIYAGEGIAQVEFETLMSSPDTDYDQKQGKYQGQAAVPTVASVKH